MYVLNELNRFMKEIPLKIYETKDGEITDVGVRWGFCGYADKVFGRKKVLRFLDLLENDKKLQKILNK